MTLAATAPVLSEGEFLLLSRAVHRATGISMGPEKRTLLQARLSKELAEGGFPSFRHYLRGVEADTSGAAMERLVNAVCTNVTQFFREPHHFAFLENELIPHLNRQWRRSKREKIRVWSAACATGEEAYSIAMTFADGLEDFAARDFRVLGSDLSTRALTAALRGSFSEGALLPVPAVKRRKYFSGPSVDPDLRERVIFRRINLMDEAFPLTLPLDAIFCRNAMIYFDAPSRQRLLLKLYRHLKPGGYLFVGHAESLTGFDHGYAYVMPTVYQRPES